MKIVLTGAGGLLGRDLWLKLGTTDNELCAVGRQKPSWIQPPEWRPLDITKPADTHAVITRFNPDLVIHAAALSDVDQCENSPEEAFRTNALGTRNIALACQRFDTALLYISTNYVFNGERCPSEGYREFDCPHPVNQYGQSKLWGEEFVKTLLNKFYIVRTAGLFGSARHCFALTVSNACRHGQSIKVASDWIGSVTYAADLAGALSHLSRSNLYGTYHVTNPGSCSREEFARFISIRLSPSPGFKILSVKAKDLKLKAERPSPVILDNFHWRLSGFAPLRNWKEAITEFINRNSGG